MYLQVMQVPFFGGGRGFFLLRLHCVNLYKAGDRKQKRTYNSLRV